jgi:hypothetical protein
LQVKATRHWILLGDSGHLTVVGTATLRYTYLLIGNERNEQQTGYIAELMYFQLTYLAPINQ